MFSNIGGKIKTLALIFSMLGIFASIIYGALFIIETDEYLVGFVIILGGALLSWIGSFFCYGFGQLVENTDILVEQGQARLSPSTHSKPVYPPISRVETNVQWKCSFCGQMISETICPHCGNNSVSIPL